MDFVSVLGGVRTPITVSGSTGTPLWWLARSVCGGGREGALELAKLIKKHAEKSSAGIDDDDDNLCNPKEWSKWFSSFCDDEDGQKFAKALLESGADINAVGVDIDGNESTPLFWADKVVRSTATAARPEVSRDQDVFFASVAGTAAPAPPKPRPGSVGGSASNRS
mmetsp:Transcript_16186/g.39461  ORF Transcript_16186/g.39461 Transcript_16186/m.39461 type:complete len:166 (+) Transcript_16186:372-869(+)